MEKKLCIQLVISPIWFTIISQVYILNSSSSNEPTPHLSLTIGPNLCMCFLGFLQLFLCNHKAYRTIQLMSQQLRHDKFLSAKFIKLSCFSPTSFDVIAQKNHTNTFESLLLLISPNTIRAIRAKELSVQALRGCWWNYEGRDSPEPDADNHNCGIVRLSVWKVLEHFREVNSIILLTSKCWQSENPVAAPVWADQQMCQIF